jgi:hypothetical protein
MFRFALVLLGLGLFVGFLGFQETRLWLASSGTPTELTLAELERNGPGNNRYIKVSEFLCTPSYIYKAKKDNKANFTVVYLPAVSVDSAYGKQVHKIVTEAFAKGEKNIAEIEKRIPPFSGKFPLLIKSNKARDEQEVDALMSADEIEGLVINSVESLGSEESNFLKQSYPGMDMDQVVILDHGRKPTAFLMLLVYYGGSVLLIGAGAGVGLAKLKTAGKH